MLCPVFKGCSSDGNVTGNRFVGGIVGYEYWSTIENCISNSNVAGKEFVDGIAGDKTDFTKIIDCISKGKVICD